MIDLKGARESVSESDVTIVGAGIAGLGLSILLSARGVSSTILERYPDPRRHLRGPLQSINLALSHRGLRVLEMASALDEIRSLLVPMYGRMVHGPESDSFQPYDFDEKAAVFSVRREAIVNSLSNQARKSGRVKIVFSCACTFINLGTKTLSLEDSMGNRSQVAFKRLIGTDGCRSIVRQAIESEMSSGHSSIQCLDHGYKELELDPEVTVNLQLHPHALHIWPGGEFMLIALPNPDGSFTATLFMPRMGPDSFECLNSGSISELLTSHLPRHPELVPALAKSFSRTPVGNIVTVSANRWHSGDTALVLGDAAHAIAPFFGQGMNCALEDCRILSEAIEAGNDWHGIFDTFECGRKPDTEAISLLSRNNYVEMRRSVVEPHYLEKREIVRILTQRYPEQFVPLYSMVAFTSIPYSLALRRHTIQDEIVETLCNPGYPIDFNLADRLVSERLSGLRAGCGSQAWLATAASV
jgi:kynurenine 3-monooxygenase